MRRRDEYRWPNDRNEKVLKYSSGQLENFQFSSLLQVHFEAHNDIIIQLVRFAFYATKVNLISPECILRKTKAEVFLKKLSFPSCLGWQKNQMAKWCDSWFWAKIRNNNFRTSVGKCKPIPYFAVVRQRASKATRIVQTLCSEAKVLLDLVARFNQSICTTLPFA